MTDLNLDLAKLAVRRLHSGLESEGRVETQSGTPECPFNLPELQQYVTKAATPWATTFAAP
jgi:hypothetical protein